jgi:serine/threonine-protein kinase
LLTPGARAAIIVLMSLTRELNCYSLIGTRIGSFRIDSWLGAGSMSVVYRGTRESTGRRAAIKVARRTAAADVGRFIDAGELLFQLRHPNIGRILAMGRYRAIDYHAIEYIPGVTVAQRLAEHGPHSWPDVVAIGREICSALRYLHDRGVIHRNLKPAHLIVSAQGEIKLIGFGLAQWMDVPLDAPAGRTRGTPGFMAPEQLEFRPSSSPRSDLYALGVVLWHLLTGAEPYQELWSSERPRTRDSIVAAHLSEPPPRPGSRVIGIPNRLDDLVVQLMAKAPHDRPRDALEVISLLEQIPLDAPGARHARFISSSARQRPDQ